MILRAACGLALALGLAVSTSFGWGWWDARSDADALAARADALIAAGRGPDALGAERLAALLRVQDPGFYDHGGLDLSTPGAGITTMTQSLAKRVAFEEFRPGWAKIRQTGYAMGLEGRLSKRRIAALWLDTVEMGRGPEGWVTGFFEAARGSPRDLADAEFHRLLAVLIAQGRLTREDGARELAARTARIARLVAGDCEPRDHGDVWLEGCA